MISLGARYMAASALAFSVMMALVKLAGRHLPSQEIVLARAIVTLVLSYGILKAARRNPWGTNRRLLLFRGVLGFVGLSCVYYAVTHLPLAEATVLHYVQPVFTSLLALLFLREALHRGVVLSCAASLVGVVLVTRPAFLFGEASSALDPVAAGVAVLGAFFSASAYIVVRRLAATEDPVVIVLYFPLVAVPASIPPLVPVAVWPAGIDWLVLLGVGVTAQLGQVWLTRGLQKETAGRATAVTYLQVVFCALWGVLFFGEVPNAWTATGAGLILVSTLLLAIHPRRP